MLLPICTIGLFNNPPPWPDIILCDVDGTLTRTSKRAAQIADLSDLIGISFSSIALKGAYFLQSSVRAAGLSGDFTKALKGWGLQKLSTPRAEAPELLQTAGEQNIPVLLVSNAPSRWSRSLLKRHGLKEGFEAVHASRGGRQIKNNPLGFVENVLTPHPAIEGREAVIWVVGDGAMDVRFAQKANPLSRHTVIPVTFEGTPAARALRNGHPDNRGIIFASFEQISRFLRTPASTTRAAIGFGVDYSPSP